MNANPSGIYPETDTRHAMHHWAYRVSAGGGPDLAPVLSKDVTPAEVHQHLVEHPDPVLLTAAGLRPDILPDTIHLIATSEQGDLFSDVAITLAVNPATEARSLRKLVDGGQYAASPALLVAIAVHPNCDEETLNAIAAGDFPGTGEPYREALVVAGAVLRSRTPRA